MGSSSGNGLEVLGTSIPIHKAYFCLLMIAMKFEEDGLHSERLVPGSKAIVGLQDVS